MAAKHTPAPFTAEEGGKRGAWIKGADGHWLCLSCGDTDEEAAANTAFIVRAVNAYGDLVEALKALDDHWTRGFPGGPDAADLGYGLGRIAPDTIAVWRAARAALAKAEA